MLVKQIKKHGRLGLGGEGILRTFSRDVQARDVKQAAIYHGITYFDSGKNFKPLAAGEKTMLLEVFKPVAPRLAYYSGVI